MSVFQLYAAYGAPIVLLAIGIGLRYLNRYRLTGTMLRIEKHQR